MSSQLSALIQLAHEPSSERRRELLRGVTDLFFETEVHAASQMALFDDVMGQLTLEMETAVRAELSTRLAQSSAPPPSIVRRLATDEIAVAAPMLVHSSALSEDDLLQVARTHGQDHLRAISRRSAVSLVVSEAIVERGDDTTLSVLIRNDGAALSRQAHETVVDRAARNRDLQEAVVNRQAVPIDLLNDMYFTVEAKLRERIMQRNAAIDPAELEAALSAARQGLAERDGALPKDYKQAVESIKLLQMTGGITPQALAGMLRAHQITRFLVALSELADIDFHTARRILDRRELDILAIVCKAAGFDRALFLTFVMLILDRAPEAMARAKQYGEMYSALPKDSAKRTIRFWKMRRQTGDLAAA